MVLGATTRNVACIALCASALALVLFSVPAAVGASANVLKVPDEAFANVNRGPLTVDPGVPVVGSGAHADIILNDNAGFRALDTAGGGPSTATFVNLQATCGATCKKTLGDETTLSLCPPTGETWNFRWSSAISTTGNGNVACSASARVLAVHSNGFISFQSGTICSGAACYTSTNLPSTALPNTAVYGAWHDLYPSCTFGGVNGGVYAQEQGAIGSRVLIIQFYNVPWAAWCDGMENFEFKLYESDNHVEVIYLTQTPGTFYSASLHAMRAGEESSAGAAGIQAYGGSSTYSPPSNTAISYTDVVAPIVGSTTVTCGTAGLAGWCRSLTNSVTAVDNNDLGITAIGVGVKARELLVDGTSAGAYTSNAAKSLSLAEGTHTLQARATDWANNVGTRSAQLNLDVSLPAISLTLDCALSGNGECLDVADLAVSATDAVSGVSTIACTLDGAAVDCSSGSISTSVLGSHTFEVTVTDVAGNSAVSSRAFDLIAGAPTVTLDAICDFLGLNDWCRGVVSVTASALDPNSGLAEGQPVCALDGATSDCVLAVATPGEHTFTISATNNNGVTTSGSREFKIDAIGPALTLAPACAAEGALGWCLGDIAIAASVDDATSGVASFACSLDGQATGCETLAIATDGTHSVAATATDAAGNEQSVSLDLARDASPPAVGIALDCALPGNLGYCLSAAVGLLATSSDATSGLATVTCAHDDVAVACDGVVVGEGGHTVSISAADVAGNAASAQAPVAIDSIAPALTFSADCASLGELGWCLGDVTASASATDATSGLDAVACTIDGIVAACDAMSIDVDGTHSIAASATDLAGNVALSSATAQRDATAPTLDLAIVCALPGAPGFCLSASFEFAASGADATSGLGAIACTLDGVATDCAASVLGDGLHTVAVNAADLAGNVASEQASVTIESAAPTLAIAIDCASAGQGVWCLAGSLGYAASASAPVSGLAEGQPTCTIDGEAAPCSGVLATPGLHAIGVSAVSNAGASASTSVVVGLDDLAPNLALDFDCASPGTSGWCLSAAIGFDASAADATSGVASVACALDGAPAGCAGLLDGEGAHTLAIVATDAAGNSASLSRQIGVDSIAPTISATHAGTPGSNGWFRSSVSTTLTCADGTSGVASFTYAVGSVDPVAYTTPFTIAQQGSHPLAVACVDAAGNAASSLRAVKIDSGAPEGTVSAPRLATSGFDVAWSAADDVSGLQYVEIQSISNFGALGSAPETLCTEVVTGDEATGVCHVDSTLSVACYRIVVVDVAGNSHVSDIVELADPTNAAGALLQACTVNGTPGGTSVVTTLPKRPKPL